MSGQARGEASSTAASDRAEDGGRPGAAAHPLRLYDNFSRSVREFSPLVPGAPVGLYTCGPTVYDYQHIGNFRTFLFEDTLKRVLMFNGYRVRHVMNITDVGHLTSDADTGEDKMEKGARRTGRRAGTSACPATCASPPGRRPKRLGDRRALYAGVRSGHRIAQHPSA